MKADSSPFRAQLIDRALRTEYDRILNKMVEIKSKYDSGMQSLSETMPLISNQTQMLDEIHRMLVEKKV